MVIASFLHYARANGWELTPRTRYLLGESIFRNVSKAMAEQHEGRDCCMSWSVANSYERRYGGQPLDGRRVIIYRENAFGDNLMVSGLAHYMKHLHGSASIDVHSVPAMLDVWVNNPDVNFCGCPVTFDAMRSADYHILLEGMIENDSEPEQQNAYDALFDFCGLHHFHVPAEFKRPHIVWGKCDDDTAVRWREMRPAWRYVLWHVTPSCPMRMLPPEQQAEALRMVADHIDVVLVGRQAGSPPIPIDHPRVHDWTERTGNWRALLPMIRQAKCVIAPDSSVLHAAGAFPDVPIVGLWGPFAARDRAKYYGNHHEISAHDACPYSPCHPQRSEMPRHKCNAAAGYREDEPWCCAMKAISPERIAAKVVELI